MSNYTKIFINANELKTIIKEKDKIIIFDSSFYLPNTGISAEKEYLKEHIINSIFFDIDKISDPNDKLPHMFPSKEVFTNHMQKLGLNNDDHVIIYDNSPLLSSARCWFMLRYFGHKKISILEGGIKEWKIIGGEISNKINHKTKGNFVAIEKNTELVLKIDQVNQISTSQSNKILDARSYERFSGMGKEPRPGLQSGHIPNSLNLPANDLISSPGFLKNNDELKKIISKFNISKNEKFVATCGSGVSACVIALVFYSLMNNKNVSIYDGSWTEWASKGYQINKY
tara:strand:- start:309 stop:1163 length:855 start_codon:yes stop_codon:yes gene_type:complete